MLRKMKRQVSFLLVMAMVLGFVCVPGILPVTKAAETTSVNLLTNPGFEDRDQVPGWNTSPNPAPYMELSSDYVKDGSYSIQVNAGGKWVWSDKVTGITEGTAYVMTADVLADPNVDGAAIVQGYIRFYDDENNETRTPAVTLDLTENKGTWQTVTVKASAPKGATKADVLLVTTGASVGTVFYDNVSLMMDPARFEPTVLFEENFDNTTMNTNKDVPTGWQGSFAAEDDGKDVDLDYDVKMGESGASMKVVRGETASGAMTPYYKLNHAITAGTSYRVSLDIKADADKSIQFYVTTSDSSNLQNYCETGTGEWVSRSYTFTAVADATCFYIQLGFNSATTGTVWYDNLKLEELPAADPSIVLEDTFEDGVADWKAARDTVTVTADSEVAEDGSGMKVVKTGTGSGSSYIYREWSNVALVEGRTYEVRVKAYGVDSDFMLVMQRKIDGSYALVFNQGLPISAKDDWTEVSHQFTATADDVAASLMRISLDVRNEWEGTIYFDELKIVDVAAEAAKEAEGNRLSNASFETAVAVDGWSNPSGSKMAPYTLQSAEQVKEGNYAIKLLDTTDNGGLQYTSTPLSVTAGDKYTATAEVYGSGTMQMGIRFLDEAGKYTSDMQTLKGVDDPTDWTTLTVTATVPENAVQVCVVLATAKTSTGAAYFDNITLGQSVCAHEWTDGVCTACGETCEHTWGDAVIGEDDIATYTCTVCGSTKAEEPVVEITRSDVSTKYYSIAEAVLAAQDGDTLKLLRDTDETVNLLRNTTLNNITLDGNDCTLTGILHIYTSANADWNTGLTIKNVTFDGSNGGFLRLGNAKLENLTIQDCYFIEGAYVKQYDNGSAKNVVISGCTFDVAANATGLASAISLSNVENLTIKANTIESVQWNAFQIGSSTGEIKFIDNEITWDVSADVDGAYNLVNLKDAKVTIKDASITLGEANAENVVVNVQGAETSNVVIYLYNDVKVATELLASEEEADGYKIYCTGHSYDAGVVTDPTCTKPGYTTYTCSVCGNSYTADETPATGEHDYVDGVCSDCGAKEPAEEVTGTITANGHSLSLEGNIWINKYVIIEGFEGVDLTKDAGLLIWTSEIAEEDAVFGTGNPIVKEGLLYNGLYGGKPEYGQLTDGIKAPFYGNKLYMRVYVKVGETYHYGAFTAYSVEDYCRGRIQKSSDAALKTLCAAVLEYGAMAQIRFSNVEGVNTEVLVNEGLDSSLKTEFSEEMIVALDTEYETKITAADTAIVSANGRSISLNEGLLINYYFKTTLTNIQSAELLTWDKEVEGELTYENAMKTALTYAGGEYAASGALVPAPYCGDTIYACARFVDAEGTEYYTAVDAYSTHKYAENQFAKANLTEANRNLLEALIVYSHLANTKFAK